MGMNDYVQQARKAIETLNNAGTDETQQQEALNQLIDAGFNALTLWARRFDRENSPGSRETPTPQPGALTQNHGERR